MPRTPPRPLVGLVAGIAAGLVASAAMSGFQAAAAKLMPSDGGDEDPATVKAADRVAVATTGARVPEPRRRQAGEAVHYAVGAALGGIYGVLAEYRPETRSGFGSAYGLVTSVVLDEVAVPATGLGAAPWQASLTSHGYGLASHLVFGTALEAARALLAGRR